MTQAQLVMVFVRVQIKKAATFRKASDRNFGVVDLMHIRKHDYTKRFSFE